MYPMSERQFNRWVAVLREHFPDHPSLRNLGTEWYASGRHISHESIHLIAIVLGLILVLGIIGVRTLAGRP